MSYCRFSCNDYQCDLYVYQNVYGGYSVHVAANRAVFKTKLPKPVPFGPDKKSIEVWMKRHNKVMNMRDRAKLVNIKHPDAGKTFMFHTATEAAEKIRWLMNEGFRVPDHVIPALLEDA